MKVYTKAGDRGKTSLIGGERVGKDDPRVEAYGTADELSAFVALLRDQMAEHDSSSMQHDSATPAPLADLRDDMARILGDLMYVQASLAGGKPMQEGAELHLERRIDELSEKLPPIERFTLPGGHPLVSLAHVCRTVCRRAERCAVQADAWGRHSEPADRQAWNLRAERALKYLNRLSDYLYIVSRTLTLRLGVAELYWEPMVNG